MKDRLEEITNYYKRKNITIEYYYANKSYRSVYCKPGKECVIYQLNKPKNILAKAVAETKKLAKCQAINNLYSKIKSEKVTHFLQMR